MGHNLCLDIFGGPSEQEAAVGLPVHGEAPLVTYDISERGDELVMAQPPLAELQVERRIELRGRAPSGFARACKPWGHGSACRLDPARDARAAVSAKGVTEF